MRTKETWRGSSARFWRVLMAHVLAIALIVSSVPTHVDAADQGFSTASLSLTSDTGSASDDTSSPVEHGLVVHATCGCHVAVPAMVVAGVRLPIVIATPLPTPTDMWARTGPALLPFEPPRA